MPARDPRAILPTHEVTNQPRPLVDYNLFDTDAALREALEREGAGWAEDKVRAFGQVLGTEQAQHAGEQANKYEPELRTFDRFGHRIDEVEFHPGYHEMMRLGLEHEVSSLAWTAKKPGAHVAHVALEYMLIQVEAGVCCPITMTYAAIPALRHQPEIAAEWEPRLTAAKYDPRAIPVEEKSGATMGMAMTEKQGGSDVRANTTRARALNGGGPGAEYELTGHKWFCSAPMCDAFLTLAYTDNGLSCFLVPRWTPDGRRNPFLIQRLKDKLGNRSNASSEIEYQDTWARMVGEEGRGVRTILEMVHHTRLDASLAPAGMMRQALAQAINHASYRTAFQKRLVDQPLMKNVLADLAIECEASTTMIMRIARAFDEGEGDEQAKLFARIAVAMAKYWLNKRAAALSFEAMECLGGAGYVEESIMPRIYREIPVNSIWEGSGNVIALDILRAMAKEPGSIEALLDEIQAGAGADKRLDAAIEATKSQLADHADMETRARRLTEMLAMVLQGSLLVRHAPAEVADAYCATRLAGDWGQTFGTMPSGLALDRIVERASPLAA